MQTSFPTYPLVFWSIMFLVLFSPLLLAVLPWKSKTASRIAAAMLGISAFLLVLMSVLVDQTLGISASWAFTLGVFALAGSICWAVRLRHQSVFAVVTIGLFAVFVLVQHFMDLSPVKPFRRFFAAVEPGMTGAEVKRLLQQEFPDGFRFPRPVRRDVSRDQMDFFLDPTESAWNAEAVFIHLSGGRVVTKQYSRD